MVDKLKPEEVWYLKKMMELSEKDLAEGRTYTHEQVKEYLNVRRQGNKAITADELLHRLHPRIEGMFIKANS